MEDQLKYIIIYITQDILDFMSQTRTKLNKNIYTNQNDDVIYTSPPSCPTPSSTLSQVFQAFQAYFRAKVALIKLRENLNN